MIRSVLIATLLATAATTAYARGPSPCQNPASVPVPPPAAPGPSAAARPTVPPGAVGVPIRLAEPAVLAMVRPGDRVDLYAAGATGPGAPARPVAAAALVLGVGSPDEPVPGGILLALRPDEARRAVGAPPDTRFAVLVRAPR